MRSTAAPPSGSTTAISCPRCGGALTAIDFQRTGIAVFRRSACEGILAPLDSAELIDAKFRFLREQGASFAALGETLAQSEKRRMEKNYGPAGSRLRKNIFH